jgi:hypothetical protein
MFMCVGSKACTWLLTCPTTHAFCLSLIHFLTTLRTHLGLPHPIVVNLSRCQCGHTIDYSDTHLFWCPCGNERTSAHDTFWDIIACIALENGPHV